MQHEKSCCVLLKLKQNKISLLINVFLDLGLVFTSFNWINLEREQRSPEESGVQRDGPAGDAEGCSESLCYLSLKKSD